MSVNDTLGALFRLNAYQSEVAAVERFSRERKFDPRESYGSMLGLHRKVQKQGLRTSVPLGWYAKHMLNPPTSWGQPFSVDFDSINTALLFGPSGSGKSRTVLGYIHRACAVAAQTGEYSISVISGKPEPYFLNGVVLACQKHKLDARLVSDLPGLPSAICNPLDQSLRRALNDNKKFSELLLCGLGLRYDQAVYGQSWFVSGMKIAVKRAFDLFDIRTPDDPKILRIVYETKEAMRSLRMSEKDLDAARHVLNHLEMLATVPHAVISSGKSGNAKRKLQECGMPVDVMRGLLANRVDWLQTLLRPKQVNILYLSDTDEGTLLSNMYVMGLVWAAQYLTAHQSGNGVKHLLLLDDSRVFDNNLARIVAKMRNTDVKLWLATQTMNQLAREKRDEIVGLANLVQDFGSDDKVQCDYLIDSSHKVPVAENTWDANNRELSHHTVELPSVDKRLIDDTFIDPDRSLVRLSVQGDDRSRKTVALYSPAILSKEESDKLGESTLGPCPGHFRAEDYPKLVDPDATKKLLAEIAREDKQREERKRQGERNRDRRAADANQQGEAEREMLRLLLEQGKTEREALSKRIEFLEGLVRETVGERVNGQGSPPRPQATENKVNGAAKRTPQSTNGSKRKRKKQNRKSQPGGKAKRENGKQQRTLLELPEPEALVKRHNANGEGKR